MVVVMVVVVMDGDVGVHGRGYMRSFERDDNSLMDHTMIMVT